ncbi:hypothetical protein KDA_52760 [Dictyobacter alpinus]|uniref:Uncharacterized protein n=1 Tax=Dictyobacter alpinus TaxID=2014873 RepID=A0A402BES7_9CHLR|nr:hypothetical protein KDA_52760 [Dictyobacter alpinus]
MAQSNKPEKTNVYTFMKSNGLHEAQTLQTAASKDRGSATAKSGFAEPAQSATA